MDGKIKVYFYCNQPTFGVGNKITQIVIIRVPQSIRFAKEYNAFFGQYTYDDKAGVIPLRRNKGEKHLIKYFSSINKSVESYFNNINTHYAYSEFRKIRKILRDQNNLNDPLYTSLLANKLNVYADDSNYVDTINSIINVNKLTQFDNAKYLTTKL